MLLHGNLSYKKSVMQKCCSSQVSSRDEYTLSAERETPNALVVVRSGNEARHGPRNVTLHRLRLRFVLTRLVTGHPWIAVCVKSKTVFAYVIHVLNVSHLVLSSRVARTSRISFSTRTSRMVAEHWFVQVDPRHYDLHLQSTTSAATMGVKRKPPDQTVMVMVTTDNVVENMISLKA